MNDFDVLRGRRQEVPNHVNLVCHLLSLCVWRFPNIGIKILGRVWVNQSGTCVFFPTRNVIFELDSQVVVDAIENPIEDVSEIGSVINCCMDSLLIV